MKGERPMRFARVRAARTKNTSLHAEGTCQERSHRLKVAGAKQREQHESAAGVDS